MQPIDMRKQFQGLQGIINQEIKRYLTQDEAFIFIGKTGSTAKILHREGNGLTLYVRKLSSDVFKYLNLIEINALVHSNIENSSKIVKVGSLFWWEINF